MPVNGAFLHVLMAAVLGLVRTCTVAVGSGQSLHPSANFKDTHKDGLGHA